MPSRIVSICAATSSIERHPVDTPDQALGLVIREDRRGLGAIFCHSSPHRLLIVIGPALELGRAADVAYSRHLRRPETVVITGPALGAGEAAGDPCHQRLLVHGKLNHMIEMATAFDKKPIKRLGLSSRSREAVENRAASRAAIEPLADQCGDDLVADEFAAIHDRLHLFADRRPARARLAQHVAGRQLDHAARRLQPSGLSPLPGARRSQKDDVQHCGALSLFAEPEISAVEAWS